MISSKRGSEYNVAWNHIKNLSPHCDIKLIYGTTGNHMGEKIEDFELDNLNIERIFIKPDIITQLYNLPNKSGIFKYSFYLAYKRWQFLAYEHCKKNNLFDKIDLLHFLNPIGFREPGVWYKAKVPFLWGPIGGFPLKEKTAKIDLGTEIYNIINVFQRRKISVKTSIRKAKKVYAATLENKDLIDSTYSINSHYIPENGIPDDSISISEERFTNIKDLNIVWIGSNEKRKRLDLFLESILRITKISAKVNVIGVNPIKDYLVPKNIHLIFHEKLAREEVINILDQSHVHIITSNREGNPTVLWEAASRGVPTISFSNSGMSDTIPQGLGILLDKNSNSSDLAKTIENLVLNKTILDLHKIVVDNLHKFKWSSRTIFWLDQYNKSV